MSGSGDAASDGRRGPRSDPRSGAEGSEVTGGGAAIDKSAAPASVAAISPVPPDAHSPGAHAASHTSVTEEAAVAPVAEEPAPLIKPQRKATLPTVLVLESVPVAPAVKALPADGVIVTSQHPCTCHNGAAQPCWMCRHGARLPPPSHHPLPLEWLVGTALPVTPLQPPSTPASGRDSGRGSTHKPAHKRTGATVNGAASKPTPVVVGEGASVVGPEVVTVAVPGVSVDVEAIGRLAKQAVHCAECAAALTAAIQRRARTDASFQVR